MSYKMEPILFLIAGILNVMGQSNNYGIDSEKHPHLKDVRVRRQIDYQPYAFDDKNHIDNTPDAMKDILSVNPVLERESDIVEKRDADPYKTVYIDVQNNGYDTKPPHYILPSPIRQHGYINGMKKNYLYDKKRPNGYKIDQVTNNNPYQNTLNGNSINHKYNEHDNGYNRNDNGYNRIDNGYNRNDNENGYDRPIFKRSITTTSKPRVTLKTDSAQFLKGFGCNNFMKLIHIADKTLCTNTKKDSEEFFEN